MPGCAGRRQHLAPPLPGQLLKTRLLPEHCTFAQSHNARHLTEIGEAHLLKIGLHQQVLCAQQGQIALLVLTNQDVEHPVGHRQRIACRSVAQVTVLPKVRGHDHRGSLLQRDLNRQVGDQASVHIGFSIDLDGRKDAGCSHAGPNGQVQRPFTKHGQLTVTVTGRHSPEGNSQLVKVHMRRQMRSQLLQQGQKALAIAHTPGKAELPVLEAKLQIDRVLPLVFTGPQRQL